MLSPSPVIQSAPGTRTVPVIRFVRGSIRTTLPSVWSLTHSAPRYAVSPFGSVPTLIFLTTFPFVIRHTVPSPAFATHADPNPHSMSYGWKPTGTRVVTFAVFVSTRTAMLSALSTAQTAPGAGGEVEDARADRDAREDLAGRGVDADHVAAAEPADPDAAAAGREPERRAPDLGRRRRPGEKSSSAAAISFISSYSTAAPRRS